LGRNAGHSITADLSRPKSLNLTGRFDVLVHLAPLWLLPENLDAVLRSGVTRVIAFSSTSAETKRSSPEDADRRLASALLTAEANIREAVAYRAVGVTLFRPTMIYGFGRDGNVAAIARFVKRLGFFPIAGTGRGLRQPVHALDLAGATASCMDLQWTWGENYSLGGAEKLSYRDMVARIFRAMERTPRILNVPAPMYSGLIRVAARLGLLGAVSPGAARRMNEDLCFDIGPAEKDFGYRGSRFLENPDRDLPF
jgi:nucleoside-diphosphate-sugar epimerase